VKGEAGVFRENGYQDTMRMMFPCCQDTSTCPTPFCMQQWLYHNQNTSDVIVGLIFSTELIYIYRI